MDPNSNLLADIKSPSIEGRAVESKAKAMAEEIREEIKVGRRVARKRDYSHTPTETGEGRGRAPPGEGCVSEHERGEGRESGGGGGGSEGR